MDTTANATIITVCSKRARYPESTQTVIDEPLALADFETGQ